MAPSNVENFSPHIIKQISRELVELTRNPLEGIRIVFNEDDVTSVQADIDGPPGTPYHGGSFRLRLVLGRNGEICVNTLKKDWNQDLGIKHILLTIKCLLIAPNPESALNEEAGKMLLEQYEDYCKRAKMMTEIHAPRAKIMENQDDCQQQPASSTSVVASNNLSNSSINGNNNTAMCDKTASSSATKSSAIKHSHDGVCCSDEPVTKRLNNILDCYNTSPTASDHITNNLQQQQQQLQQQQQQQLQQQQQQPGTNLSQSSKSSQGSTSATNNARNRGLKRVLRLRS